jgi:hypothetical protein
MVLPEYPKSMGAVQILGDEEELVLLLRRVKP